MKSGIVKTKTGFISKTLQQLSRVLEYEFYSERYVQNGMLLQCIAPVVKVLLLVLFLIITAASSNIVVLLALAVIALVYAKLSGLAMKNFIRRAWAYLPVIVLICSLPGTSSLLLKGTPFLTMLKPGTFDMKDGWYFTATGLKMAFILALRSGVSISFALLLLLTTRWSQVTGALIQLRVPSVFVSILNMAYRYIFIIVETANHMMEARFLRTVGRMTAGDNRKFIGHSIGYLFMRSFAMSEAVYDAMRCRNFSGKTAAVSGTRISGTDILFAVSNLLIMMIVLMGERIF